MAVFMVIGILTIVVASMTIIGVTLHEIRAVQREKSIIDHPYAKKWRARPLVSIIIKGTPTDACLVSIKNNNYRKKEIITSSAQTPKGEFIIYIHSTTILTPTAILDAVHKLNSQKNLQYVELPQIVTTPDSLKQLLTNYRLLVQAIFQKSRNGLGIDLHATPANHIVRREQIHTSFVQKTRNILYELIALIAKITLTITLTYLLYIGFVAKQPDALLIALAMFGSFMVSAIWGYQQLLFMQKFYYFTLLPVSLGFFIIASWISAIQSATQLVLYGGRALLHINKRSHI
jgi:hypothetical protein